MKAYHTVLFIVALALYPSFFLTHEGFVKAQTHGTGYLGSLDQDTKLQVNDVLFSTTKKCYLELQSNGNIVIKTIGNQIIWATNIIRYDLTMGYLVMQSDGNLVAYDVNGQYFWASWTQNMGSAPYTLTLGDDGTLNVVDGTNKTLWTNPGINADAFNIDINVNVPLQLLPENQPFNQGLSIFYADCEHYFTLDTSGVLSVLQTPDGHVVWSSQNDEPGTPGGYTAVLLDTGFLVIKDINGKQIWSSSGYTPTKGPYALWMQAQGLIYIRDGNQDAIWHNF